MNRSLSIYLDLVRFLAAFVVFAQHLALPHLTGGWLDPLEGFGDEAVMVFFVLSGLVICHVATTREHDVGQFMIHRLARLYSVVIPALILTAILDPLGHRIAPDFYGWWYQDSRPFIRIMANALFVNEFWFLSIRPFTNGVFWSLSYEFSYYVLFAAAFYFRGRTRIALIAVIALVVGPKILLLLPIWLLGVVVYHRLQNHTPSRAVGWTMFVGSFVLYGLGHASGLIEWLKFLPNNYVDPDLLARSMPFARLFLAHYVVGALVCINFLGFSAISGDVESVMLAIRKPVRFLAAYTFSIYLFHFPLLHFYAAVFDIQPDARGQHLILGAAVFATILILGTFTERRKDVARRLITAIYERLRGILGSAPYRGLR